MAKPTELTLEQSLKKVSYTAKTAPHRMRLDVPFSEKDRAKAVGAKWDGTVKAWFMPADAEISKFSRWLPGCSWENGRGWISTCGAQRMVFVEGSEVSPSGVQMCTNCGAHIPFGFN